MLKQNKAIFIGFITMSATMSSFCNKKNLREYLIYFYSFIKIMFKDIIIDESLEHALEHQV